MVSMTTICRKQHFGSKQNYDDENIRVGYGKFQGVPTYISLLYTRATINTTQCVNTSPNQSSSRPTFPFIHCSSHLKEGRWTDDYSHVDTEKFPRAPPLAAACCYCFVMFPLPRHRRPSATHVCRLLRFRKTEPNVSLCRASHSVSFVLGQLSGADRRL